MRKWFLIGFMAVAIGATAVLGGAKRITKFGGTITDTLIDADNETHLSDKYVISPPNPNNVTNNLTYDELVMGFNVPAMTQINTVGGEGNVDSVIIRIMTGVGANVDTLGIFTASSLPATFLMRYAHGAVNDSSKAFDTDSLIGFTKSFKDSTTLGMLGDEFWFSAYVVDSAGSGDDSLIYTVDWWAKWVEHK